ncbi:MAG: hypothetical protein LBC62_06165 [Treponema sp.]|nr:hypothetical protein [Treponema sp.]
MIQFAKQGGFTRRIGNFVVTGQYRVPEADTPPGEPNEYLLTGDASVFFGGLEFRMGSESEESSLRLFNEKGAESEILPDRMIVSGETAVFRLPGGTELSFTTQYAGGALELRITCSFAEGSRELELPYKPMRKTGMRDSGDGRFVIISDGLNYSFGRSPLDPERRVLFLKAGGAGLTYGVVPETKSFNPQDFIIPEAQTRRSYEEVLARWVDQNFSLWNRTVSSQNDEDLVIAYSGEAISRGTYKAAVSAAAPEFLNSGQRTYESSVYLGRLTDAYRSLAAADREKLSRLSRLINEKSLEFIKEPHVFEYFAVRGHGNFMDDGAELIRSIDPKTLPVDLTAGILEGYADWKQYRPLMENPFERLLDQACFVISESLRIAPGASGGDRVLVFFGSQGDAEFNLRLGRALLAWAEESGDASWAGVARSLILSVLSLGDSSGAVKAGLLISDEGDITVSGAPLRLTSARLYRILSPGEYYPHALSIGAPVNSIWTWTAAPAVSASQENNVLDISVSFPAGETHYMILRGIRAFTKIQLYNMDFRTDPQFERYDSSGWAYAAEEQTLLLKMKHRATVEHVRVFY